MHQADPGPFRHAEPLLLRAQVQFTFAFCNAALGRLCLLCVPGMARNYAGASPAARPSQSRRLGGWVAGSCRQLPAPYLQLKISPFNFVSLTLIISLRILGQKANLLTHGSLKLSMSSEKCGVNRI